MLHKILVVDDEKDIRELIADILEDEGYEIIQAKNSKEAIEALNEHQLSLALLDIWLNNSEMDGLGILAQAKKIHPDLPVIMISGHGNIETAVKSMKNGASNYIEKPLDIDRLLSTVKPTLENQKLRKEIDELKKHTGIYAELIGESYCMAQLKIAIAKVAPTESRVFVTGASGVGKEAVGRLIHQKSNRCEGPFTIFNPASIAEERIDAEFYGTNPKSEDEIRKPGIFERAHTGTLYIDEVADLSLNSQAKLLKVLQANGFEQISTGKKIKFDIRVIASTSRDIESLVEQGKFRQDLFYRLNVVPIRVPSLSERRDDIPLLCNYFIERLVHTNGLVERHIDDVAMATMQSYAWPGNVRQLKNVVEWLLIMAPGDSSEITPKLLPPEICSDIPDVDVSTKANIMTIPLREAREQFEKHYLEAQLKRFSGNVSRTASFVGMERSALHRKLKLLGIGEEPEDDFAPIRREEAIPA